MVQGNGTFPLLGASAIANPRPPATLPAAMNPTTTAAEAALPVPRIFISATTGDLGTVRRAVADGMRGIGALAVEQEYFAPPGMTIADMLEEKIRACQAVIHIAGHRYGAEDENTPLAQRGASYADGRRSYTQLEHDLALRHGKRLYVFLCADGFPYDPAPAEPAALAALQQEHRQRLLTSSHFRHSAANDGDLTAQVAKLKDEVHLLAAELTQVSEKVDVLTGSMRRWVLIGSIAAMVIGGGVWMNSRDASDAVKNTANKSDGMSAVMRELQELKKQLATATPTLGEINKVRTRLAKTVLGAAGLDANDIIRMETTEKLDVTLKELDVRLEGERSTLTGFITTLRALKLTNANEITTARHLTRDVLQSLATAEEASVQYDAAIRHYEEAAALYDQKAEPAEWAAATNALALLRMKTGSKDDGARIAEAALEARERTLGKDHPETLGSLYTLAEHYYSIPDYAKAEPLLVRALEAKDRTLGKEHAETLVTVTNLASLYAAIAQVEKAVPLYLRMLDATERTSRVQHRVTLNIVNDLAEYYLAKGDTSKAEPLLVRILEARDRTLGKDHRDTLVTLSDLAELYLAKGDTAKAEPLCLREMETFERTLGKDHQNTLRSVANLAVLYYIKTDYVKAEPLYLRALDAFERKEGKESPDTCLAAYNLAGLYYQQGKKERAVELVRQAHRGWLKALGSEHEDTKRAAALLRELGETP